MSERTLTEKMRRASLTPSEMRFAEKLAEGHEKIRIYRSKEGAIVLSREAMYSAPVREQFWIRKPKKA